MQTKRELMNTLNMQLSLSPVTVTVMGLSSWDQMKISIKRCIPPLTHTPNIINKRSFYLQTAELWEWDLPANAPDASAWSSYLSFSTQQPASGSNAACLLDSPVPSRHPYYLCEEGSPHSQLSEANSTYRKKKKPCFLPFNGACCHSERSARVTFIESYSQQQRP